jgi:hypothetical protein
MKHASLILFLLLLSSCDASKFVTGVDRPIEGKILSSLDQVERVRQTIVLKDSGAIQLRVVGLTQFDFSIWTKLRAGEGYRILLRPVIQEAIVDSGLILSVGRSGVELREGSRIYPSKSISLLPDSLLQVRYYSENEYLYVSVGCDTVVQGKYPVKESDDIAIMSIPGSTVELSVPNWEPTYVLKIKERSDPILPPTERDEPWRLSRIK